jgi:hypothetical protein
LIFTGTLSRVLRIFGGAGSSLFFCKSLDHFPDNGAQNLQKNM